MLQEEPFNRYSRYLKKKYGQPVYRVGIDAGFSCPNRGKDRGKPGCTYCGEDGSRAPYLGTEQNLKKQIDGTIAFLKDRYSSHIYILYFQAFSSTFAPVLYLKHIYDYSLSLAPFRELIVATRPDCLDRKKAELLAGYKNMGLDVWVELGLESGHNRTLTLINRGHGAEQFVKAFNLLKEFDIKVTVHVIFGLPGENWHDIQKTVKSIASLRPDGVKIHNLNIPEDTVMYNEFLMGEFTAPVDLRHMDYTIRALEMLPPETIIMRLTTDTKREKLASPGYFMQKAKFYSLIINEMKKRKSYQGKRFLS
ncbi:MAG: TIGR01212 family radical SAM protein [Spirochaetes bacterium]|nr:TIGR01212 family radical SAM protein [Spirochaetota bacterium]